MIKLSNNERDIMNMLWNEDRPLTRTDMIALSPEKKWNERYIHAILNDLTEKGLIEVVGSVKAGRTYARTYSYAVTREEFSAMKIIEEIDDSKRGAQELKISGVFAALVETDRVNDELLSELQEIIDRKKEDLK